MMSKKLKCLAIILIYLFVIHLDTNQVHAKKGPLDNSVTDYYENEEKSFDNANLDQPTIPPDDMKSKSLNLVFLDILQMLAALIFVVLLLYFLLRFINSKSQSYKQSQLIQNFGGTSLGGNRSIQIVKVDNRLLIIGVGENINLLKEITDEAEVNRYLQQYNEQLEQYLQPVDMITKWFKKSSESTSTEMNNQSFHDLLKEKLSDIKKDRKEALGEIEKKEKNVDE